MIAIDLSKQQALDANPKAINHTNFTGKLEHAEDTFFILEEVKEIILDFPPKKTVRVM